LKKIAQNGSARLIFREKSVKIKNDYRRRLGVFASGVRRSTFTPIFPH